MKIWTSYFKKAVTFAAVIAVIAVSSLGTHITAFAATAATDSVMIRNNASTDSGIIGSLNEGDEVEILDVIQSGDGYLWYYIELENGNHGYVRSDLINASDKELADFNVEKEPEEKPEEEPAQEPEEKPEEKPEEGDNSGQQEAPASTSESEIIADASGDETAEPDAEGYDASRDPNAKFSVRFETDADGSGSWYVFNEDNGSRVRISDMQTQESAAAASSARGSGIWKILAIIFGILAIAFAAFSVFLIKSIRSARPSRPRRVVDAAIEDEEEDEGEEEEFFFEDDDDISDDGEDDESDHDEDIDSADDDEDVDDAGDDEEGDDSVNDEDVDDNGDNEDADDVGTKEETADEAEDVQDEAVMPAQEESAGRTADSTITKEIAEDVEITEIPAEEIEAAIAAKTALLENEGAVDTEEEAAEEVAEEAEEEAAEPAQEVFEEEPEVPSGEAFEEDAPADEDEEYEEEEYEDEEEDFDEEDEGGEEDFDEDYEDEDYEDEDADEEDDEETGARRRARSSRGSGPSKGGFMGFIRKVFGSDSREDEDGFEDFDEFGDEPVRREFDEFKDYPEDIDLLPKESFPDEDFAEDEQPADDGDDPADGERGRLSMQRVMKNVKYNNANAGFDDDMDDLSDSLFDDDDDMEYSFISSTRRK